MIKETLSFDDVLLVPGYSDIESRSQVDIGNDLDDAIHLDLPVISSPMDTISGVEMCITMAKLGGLAVLHRYNAISEQCQKVAQIKEALTEIHTIAAAIGVTNDYRERARELVSAGIDALCIDVAHGHHSMMERAIKAIKDAYGDKIHVMAGNVATLEGFDALASWGADSVRVGIGGGSICSTRLVSGHGVPTFQSILDISNTTYETKIIADGGLKTSGDIVKALAAGADFVMLGSMLAGTEETPGEKLTNARGESYKVYRGMASSQAQFEWRGKSSTPEGVSSTVFCKGPLTTVIEDIAGGLRSGLSYSGARSIQEFRNTAKFLVQSQSGQRESDTHILWRRG